MQFLKRGAFGCVLLAQDKATGKLVALKVIKRQEVRLTDLVLMQQLCVVDGCYAKLSRQLQLPALLFDSSAAFVVQGDDCFVMSEVLNHMRLHHPHLIPLLEVRCRFAVLLAEARLAVQAPLSSP